MTASPSLAPPWSGELDRARLAVGRFDGALHAAPVGPMRDRLGQLRSRLERAVTEAEAVAHEGQRRSLALAALGPDRVAAELKAARRAADAAGPGSPAAEAAALRLAAARTQHDVVHRLWDAVDGARAQLAAAVGRLDAVAARAVELAVLGASAPAGAAPSAGGIDDELSRVIDDLEALHAAFRDLDDLDLGGGP